VASRRSQSNLGNALETLGERASGTDEACGALKERTKDVAPQRRDMARAIEKRDDSGAARISGPVSGMLASDLSAETACQQFSRTPTSGPGLLLMLTYCFVPISGRFWMLSHCDLMPWPESS
jgi:hypothetical protein